MSKLLVIIVTYNGMKWLDKCLSSVVNSTVNADLFIVDNGSTDGSIEFIENNYPNAQFIISKENLGFGKANNIGFQYAIDHQYDYVYLLNQDAWVEDDTFELLINAHKKHSDYGIISPMQTIKDSSKLDAKFLKCCNSSILSDLLCHQKLQDIYEVNSVMAAHWLLPISTILLVGGFSPTFNHYGEDLNYINRVNFYNLKVGIAPAAYAIHDRENRKEPIKKRQYIFFVNNLVILSNPTIKRRVIRVINNYLQTLFKQKNSLNLFYGLKILLMYSQIVKNRKNSQRTKAFLNPYI